jgi:hypothetical protein
MVELINRNRNCSRGRGLRISVAVKKRKNSERRNGNLTSDAWSESSVSSGRSPFPRSLKSRLYRV